VMKGCCTRLSSRQRASNTAEPAADLSITLTDYDFQLPQPLAAGRHVVRVENAGAQAHEIAIAALLPGRRCGTSSRGTRGREGSGAHGPVAGGRVGHRPREARAVHDELRARWLSLVVLLPDAKDGKPHIMHGMAKQITVS